MAAKEDQPLLAHDSAVFDSLSPQPSAWGENLADGVDYEDVVARWMASPTQRANLLGDYDSMAIGYAVDSSGHTWYVQELVG